MTANADEQAEPGSPLAGNPGNADRWLRSGGAKTSEQEELDPKTPIFAALLDDQS